MVPKYVLIFSLKKKNKYVLTKKKVPKYVLISSNILILTKMDPLGVGIIFFFYFFQHFTSYKCIYQK